MTLNLAETNTSAKAAKGQAAVYAHNTLKYVKRAWAAAVCYFNYCIRDHSPSDIVDIVGKSCLLHFFFFLISGPVFLNKIKVKLL